MSAAHRQPGYGTWRSMIERCTNPRCDAFANYGGRGIGIHPPWRASFATFIRDVGEPPSREHTLDRIDNDAGYFPGNVRWATRAEQSRNCRKNRLLAAFGRTQCALDWANEFGIPAPTLMARIDRDKWSIERALTEPSDAASVSARKRREKTHCRDGHLLDGDNLRINRDGSRSCRECDRQRWHKRKPKPVAKSRKEHCKNGHPLTEANVRPVPNSSGISRHCRACERDRSRAYRQNREAARSALQ